jgi:hypothetical protein
MQTTDELLKRLANFNKTSNVIRKDRSLSNQDKDSRIKSEISKLFSDLPFLKDNQILLDTDEVDKHGRRIQKRFPITEDRFFNAHSNSISSAVTEAIFKESKKRILDGSVFMDLKLDSYLKDQTVQTVTGYRDEKVKQKIPLPKEVAQALELDKDYLEFDSIVQVPITEEKTFQTVSDSQGLSNAISEGVVNAFDTFKITNRIGEEPTSSHIEDSTSTEELESLNKKFEDKLFDLTTKLSTKLSDGRKVNLAEGVRNVLLGDHYKGVMDTFIDDFLAQNGIQKELKEKEETQVVRRPGKGDETMKIKKKYIVYKRTERTSQLFDSLFDVTENGLLQRDEQSVDMVLEFINRLEKSYGDRFRSFIDENGKITNRENDEKFYQYLDEQTDKTVADLEKDYKDLLQGQVTYNPVPNRFKKELAQEDVLKTMGNDILNDYYSGMSSSNLNTPKPLNNKLQGQKQNQQSMEDNNPAPEALPQGSNRNYQQSPQPNYDILANLTKGF